MNRTLQKPRAEGVTTIAQTVVTLPMSHLGGPSRLPRLRWQQPIPDKATPPSRGLTAEESADAFDWGKDSILPYGVYDDYDRAQQPADMPLIVLDNGRLRIAVAPQYGGRIMQLYDYALGRDLVFRNPVFQPANLAALNAWFSGGIEWNGLIPGHTPFTAAPVFAGVVETERGPVLRIYEFDRIVEATWQIDLFLPAGEDRLYVHGRIVNAAPVEKHAYWWTNVAVPASAGMRVISPADYAIEHVLPGNELARFAFPDPARFDGSYPGLWKGATSVFFRKPDAKRLFIAALDRTGTGLAQTATSGLKGRKFFYFGTAAGGQHWMDYLARKDEGDYIEIQAGITPTQNQRFVLAAESETRWTEVYGGLSVDPAAAHCESYAIAERATAEAVDRRFPQADLTEVDGFLTRLSQMPVDRRLAAGSPWGGRQEKLTGKPLAAGLDFSVDRPADLWDDLAESGKISAANLTRVPADLAVSDAWVAALERSAEAQGKTWLHELLLGIAALDRENVATARDLFARSTAVHPSWLGLRQQALITENGAEAERLYLAAWKAEDAPAELAVEIVQFLLRADRSAALEIFLADLPEAVAAQERIVLARASVAATQGDLDTLEALLAVEFATIREGEDLSADLWHALQTGRLEQRLGRAPTAAELETHNRANPLPEHLDFRMRVVLEDGTN
ncbi:DUF5107 domain-containing protein [Shinella sp.]|uniref:DUF5107 domain-containing protein n=1 Tax=Shinella sp. TaxID=1870904 RepID=UPI003D2DA3D5